jgi:hypothetical protein
MFNAPHGANMANATYPSAATLTNLEKKASAFVSLDSEARAAVDTQTAAYHLSREPQTLRIWACKENGPLRPMRVHGRLAWKVSDLRALLEVAQ